LRYAFFLAIVLGTAGSSAARAQEQAGAGAGHESPAPPAPPMSEPAPSGGKPNLEPPPASPPALNFDLLGDAAGARPPDPALERKVAQRRALLQLHQGLGLATLAATAATVIVGQLDFDDRFRGGGDTGRYHPWHKGLAYGSAALFAAAGTAALLAPVPYPKKLQLDTATVHKASMAVATAGMIAEIALGIAARRSAGSLHERDLAAAHQVVGYVTFGALGVGAGVFLLP